MEFGLSLKPMAPARRVVDMTLKAEQQGFQNVWVGESPILWQEVYSILSYIAANTERIRLGTFVTNPEIRDITVTASAIATINDISGGRVECGIGTGDSALRIMGKKPVKVAELGESVQLLRALWSGNAQMHNGQEVQLSWVRPPVPRIWVAGMGPRVLRKAGEVADGVILSPADPEILEWCMDNVKEGARLAGRDPSEIRVVCTAAVCMDEDVASARDKVRWFPAVVSNHVADVARHHGSDKVPRVALDYRIPPEKYDWQRHGRKDASHNALVSDEVVDRASVVGGRETVIEKIRMLEELGVDQLVCQSADWDDARALIEAVGTLV